MLNLTPPSKTPVVEPAGPVALDTPSRLRVAMKTRPLEPSRSVTVPPLAVRQPGQTRAFANVLAEVRHGLRQGDRLIVVTGESGTGKTMLCRSLIEEAELLTFTSVMLQPPATPEDLLAQFLRDVGVLDGRSSTLMTRHALVFALQRFLESLISIGARAVLIIDEAQHLTPNVLEQLRLASNFETADSALLQVVLVGQPELNTLLQWPELRRVSQRVSRRCELTGIEPDEFSTFIAECLERRAPGGLIQMTPAAERSLVTMSAGVPRVAERLCVHALELAAGANAYRIEPGVVTTAARRLGMQGPSPRAATRQLAGVAAGIALTTALAGGAWGWMNRSADPESGTTVAAGANTAPTAASPSMATGAMQPGAMETAGALTVTVATFRTESRARAVVAQLVDEGLPAFIRAAATGASYQVIVGPYVSAEEAVAAQKSLAAKGVASTEVQIETADLSRTAWQ